MDRRPEELAQLKFRDPARVRALADAARRLAERMGRTLARPVTLMHVCGTHEQALARFGLRATLPDGVDLIMGPGCPVCVTDPPEVDEGVALALDGVHVATYGDMLRVPGTTRSLADVQADGGKVHVVYSVDQAVELARRAPGAEVVFFATGFETTAVTTAATLLRDDLPSNFSVLSAHKYVPAAMELVAGMPTSKIEGFLAAGHAATITGWGLFEPLAARTRLPIVVAGFEPLDILGGVVKLLELVAAGRAEVANLFPRCVTREGNLRAQEQLWRVFRTASGRWRGIADIPDGNLRLRDDFARWDARRRFRIDLGRASQGPGAPGPSPLAARCLCGAIMAGNATPHDCPLFGKECLPESPVGACMVSSEGSCKIWHMYGGRPDLRGVGR